MENKCKGIIKTKIEGFGLIPDKIFENKAKHKYRKKCHIRNRNKKKNFKSCQIHLPCDRQLFAKVGAQGIKPSEEQCDE